MKALSPIFLAFRRLLLAAALLCVPVAQAGNLSISNVPLGTGTGITVKPNLLFILDNSGSMGWDYTPDWVDSSICQDNMSSFGDTYTCALGDVLYNWHGFNTQYYNPAVRYQPPLNADGTEWANASTSQSSPYTKTDPFKSTSTKNILGTYRQTWWCKNWGDTPPTNCVQNTGAPLLAGGGYSYPNGTYSYRKNVDNGGPFYYVAAGEPTWCFDKELTDCQAKRATTPLKYQYPRLVGAEPVAPVQATGAITITTAGRSDNHTYTISAVTVDGSNLLGSSVTVTGSNSATNRNTTATNLANSINSATGTHGFTAFANGNQVVITAPPEGAETNTYWNNKAITWTRSSTKYIKGSFSSFSGGVNTSDGSAEVVFSRVDVVSSTNSYTKHANRTDCAGATCTYQEELQNFANWYSFYRTRMLMMKTAVSRAFGSVSDTAPGAGFRVGFDVITNDSTSLELAIDDFTSTQKTNFYSELFAASPTGWTPLRAALSKAGRLYAGKLASDPVQYSCQQNFTFLTSDGYWNTNAETSSYGPKKENGSTNVGDQDGTKTSGVFDYDPPYRDALSKADTLADVAKYYWKTDLRPLLTNDVPTSAKNSASHQHMVTFAMGLGVDGTLEYSPNYETGGSLDYNKILQNTLNWPDPIANTAEQRVDDLWHAAVNGHGKYFAANDPQSVADSLSEALSGVSAMTGASAAAATSNLEPVAGDNYAYVASYVTQSWEGNIEAREINLTTGVLSSTPIWAARDLLNAQALVTPVPADASGPGSRKLYSYDASIVGTDKKFLLTWANANAKGWSSYFAPTQLNQCNPIGFCAGATEQNLFEYLMGGADTTTNLSYRERIYVLGDIVNSQPVYVKTPSFGYVDDGYAAYKGTVRKALVYVGANDGFLHAFDAQTGNEDWAYLPAALAPSLHELANSNYTHRYYVDGVLAVGDIKVSDTWKTVLVGGFGGGGKGYYALDVTDPTAPVSLWEFTDPRLGYSYGNPIITKLPAGTTSSGGDDIGGKWVALLTSGYNNGTSIGTHDGQGILYVLDAYTGTEYFRIYTCTDQDSEATCAGSTASPVGLAKVNNWVENPSYDNTTLYVYGGDLEGNLWRFTLASKSAFKVAEIGEPITVKPELAEVQGKRVMYFGSGLFLQAADKADQAKRSIYAIRDDPSATLPLQNVKTSGDLVEQTLVFVQDSTTERTIDEPQAVDWNTKYGWFIELLEDRERVNVDPKIQLGTLVVASNVPDDTGAAACTTGGHSWLNFLDITTGSFVVNNQSNPNQFASVKLGSALAVGINIVKLPNGKLITITTTSDNQHPVKETPVGAAGLPMKRVSWRELTTE